MNILPKTAAVLSALPAGALASTGADPAAGAPAGMTLAELFRLGGPLMYVLCALSVIGLALIVYYAIVLRAGTVAPDTQRLRLRELLRAGREREARTNCADRPTALAAVMAAGLDFAKENPDAPAAAVKDVMESEGVRQAGRMQSLIHYLLDLSSVAPMVGLLGTVIGMLRAFNSVAFDMAKARPMELAGGVGQALITTIAGLCVAIPALIAWAVFRGRVVKLVGRLEVASAELASLLPRKGSPE
jgi:biopolymer transport protein ExbB